MMRSLCLPCARLGVILALAVAGAPGAWASKSPDPASLPSAAASASARPQGTSTGALAITPNPGAALLSPEPFRLDVVGLTMSLPAGLTVESTDIGGVVTVQIFPADRSYVINIQVPPTEAGMSTVKEATARILEQFKAAMPVQSMNDGQQIASQAMLLEPVRELRIEGSRTTADRFYCSIPRRDKARSQVIQGYTIFRPLPSRFTIFELVCAETVLPVAKPVYELAIATARFDDPDLLMSERKAAVETGLALLARYPAEKLRLELPPDQQWFRLFKPGVQPDASDDDELGYRGVRFWAGVRSELATSVATGTPAGASLPEGPANPSGTLCRIDARVFVRLPGKASTGRDATLRVIDSQATYFLSADRSEEAWSIRVTVRDPGAARPTVYTETGARSGNVLTIALNAPSEEAKTIRPMIQGAGYVSQLEAQLLPRLLVRSGQPTEIGLYAYRSESKSVVLRRDKLIADPKGRDLWVVTTRHREEPGIQTSVLNAEGDTLRTELSDGRVWEAISPAELFTRYRTKGLPTGSETAPARRGGDRGR